MESSSDKYWAQQYLLDPLTAPEPSQETGPGSHFNSVSSAAPLSPTSPAHKRNASMGQTSPVKVSSVSSVSGLLTPPSSASPTRTNFPPTNPFAARSRDSTTYATSPRPRHSRRSVDTTTRDRRHSSSPLPSRFPGDTSMHPLDQLRQETRDAHRAPHLRRTHIPKADSIDVLDQSVFGAAYHHEGPYDATLLVRNLDPKHSPVAATQSTNEEAIRATPREHLIDALTMHVPLQGTAIVPPGAQTFSGEVMNYTEGADLQREADAPGGAYKRWPGMQYHPEDYKGKGEPSFTIERALKQNKHTHRRIVSEGTSTYELQDTRSSANKSHQRSVSNNYLDTRGNESHSRNSSGGWNGVTLDSTYAAQKSGSHGFGAGLKRRFGSLRGRKEVKA